MSGYRILVVLVRALLDCVAVRAVGKIIPEFRKGDIQTGDTVTTLVP